MTTPTISNPSAPSTRRQPSRLEAPSVQAGPADAAATIDDRILERAARVIRVLGHPLRLRLLEVLERGEHHVTDLVRASGASQALVSQHLANLRAEGVVGARRDGPRVYYRITEPKVHRILACIRDCDLPELTATTDDPLFELTDHD